MNDEERALRDTFRAKAINDAAAGGPLPGAVDARLFREATDKPTPWLSLAPGFKAAWIYMDVLFGDVASHPVERAERLSEASRELLSSVLDLAHVGDAPHLVGSGLKGLANMIATSAPRQYMVPTAVYAFERQIGRQLAVADWEGGFGYKIAQLHDGEVMQAWGKAQKNFFPYLSRVPEESWSAASVGNQLKPSWYKGQLMTRFDVSVVGDQTVLVSKVAHQEGLLLNQPQKLQYFHPDGIAVKVDRFASTHGLIPLNATP
jgi:hypothetical protein